MSTDAAPANETGVRCFLALLPDAASLQALQHCRAELEAASGGASRGVRWVEPAALHSTLRFFGAASATQVERLKRSLPSLACALPAIDARRCAIWPNRARPRLLVLELDAPPALFALAHECEALACRAGFVPEPRAYRAHLTLARLRPGCPLATPPPPPTRLKFDTLALLASERTAAGSHYRPLARTALPATATV